MTSTKSDLRALILREGEPRGPGRAVWSPSDNADRILATDDELLIFLPDGFSLYNVGYRYVTRYDVNHADLSQVKEDLDRRYPPLHRLLPRCLIVEDHHSSIYTDANGFVITEEEHEELNKRGGDEVGNVEQGHIFKSVVIEEAESRDPVYTGNDPAHAAELCRDFGGTIRVAPSVNDLPVHRRYQRDEKRNTAAAFRRKSGNEYASGNADTLEESGCYCRERPDEPSVYEVVYNPKKIAAAEKSRRTRAKNLPNGRSVNYLLVDEFWKPVYAMVRHVDRELSGFTTNYELQQSTRGGRSEAIRAIQTVIYVFNYVFGKNTHRQIQEFQQFLKLWKCYGAATRKVYSSRYGDEPFWDWLDKEAKQRKPKYRSITRDAAARTEGLW